MKVFEIDFTSIEPFELESGEVLPRIELRATVYGQLNRDKSNAVLVFHALTGSSRIAEWWGDLIGAGEPLDTDRSAYVCINFLGSCYGSTSGATLKRRNKGRMPVITTGDIVRANTLLFEHLGIRKFKRVIGGSVGGMLALQLGADYPELAEEIVAIGATPLSAMGLALNHIQRQALELGDLGLARQIAMLSYKSAGSLSERFGRRGNRNGENPRADHWARFDVGGYLDHQAKIFDARFELESYRVITKAMDLFDLTNDEIAGIRSKVSLVGISSDWLFPAAEVEALAQRFRANGVDVSYHQIDSGDGHDAFLSDIAETRRILFKIFDGAKLPVMRLRAA